MKKLIALVFVFAISFSYGQNKTLRKTTLNEKFENVFYKSPEFNYGKQVPFKVKDVTCASFFKGSDNKTVYQVTVLGTVNSNGKEATKVVTHFVNTAADLSYFSNAFMGDYKQIVVYEYTYQEQSKKRTDTSITVTY